MTLLTPLSASRLLLATTGTSVFTVGKDNIPTGGATIVISNHRSFLDAAILIQALGHPVRVACHHYMGQTPLLKEVINELGCFPLDVPEKRHASFFRRANDFLNAGRWVGLFPEGGSPMVHKTDPKKIIPFQKGFAHLALRCEVENPLVLPVAIISESETSRMAFPTRLLSFFDPTEPLFQSDSWHPVVIYHRVKVAIGRPYPIGQRERDNYRGRYGKKAVNDLIQHCQVEISDLLAKG